ncbi:MAG: hypothetical protein QG632_195, partial [Candidatus Dependentiae bacterium]|nr:hypothetical protein [Candidatus Dependentiae bacterium]
LEEDKDRIVGIFEKIIQRWVAIQEEQAGNEPKQKIAYLEKVIDDLDRNPSIPGAWQKIVALRSLVDRLSTTAQPSMQVFVDKILGFKEGLAACTDISVIEEEFLCIAKALRASALLVGVDRIMEPLKSASFVIEAIVEKWVQFTESETTGHNLQEKIYFLQDRCRSLDSERSQLSRDSQNIINVVLLMKKVALSKRIIQLFRERMKATVSFSDLMALKRDLEGFYQILDSDSDERTSVTNLIAEVQREVDKFNQ